MTTKNKPKPIVEKILLTEEQKREIDGIMNGRPTQKQISLWKQRGLTRKGRGIILEIFK